MAGSSGDRWRRPPHADLHDGDEPEEGEIVPRDDHSDVDTEEYYNRHSPLSDSDETISGFNAAACSSVPASYYGDDATSPPPPVVAANNHNAGSFPVAAATAALACPICRKEFRSQKAVCGNMKVHQQHAFGSQKKQGIRKDNKKGIKRAAAAAAAVVGAWGGTGKRGCLGLGSSKFASLNAVGSEEDQSMAIVMAEPEIVFQPMPLAFAPPVPTPSATPTQSPSSVSTASASPIQSPVPSPSPVTNVSSQSSSAQPMPNDTAMDTMAAGPANPPAPAPAVPLVADQYAAPPPPPPAAVEQAPPVHQQAPIAPPPAAAAGRQNPDGYTCAECNMWFQTHQGLGGHVAGHRNREHAAAAAEGVDGAAVPPGRRNAKPEKPHVCKECGAAFLAGVQLGGHMRKHYAGDKIVPKRKPRLVQQPLLALSPPHLALALTPNADYEAASPAPAVEAPVRSDPAPMVEGTPEPVAPGPATAGRVLLFGIDIGVGVHKPAAAQEGPSATEGSASTEQ